MPAADPIHRTGAMDALTVGLARAIREHQASAAALRD
jgi:hypothetical protein